MVLLSHSFWLYIVPCKIVSIPSCNKRKTKVTSLERKVVFMSGRTGITFVGCIKIVPRKRKRSTKAKNHFGKITCKTSFQWNKGSLGNTVPANRVPFYKKNNDTTTSNMETKISNSYMERRLSNIKTANNTKTIHMLIMKFINIIAPTFMGVGSVAQPAMRFQKCSRKRRRRHIVWEIDDFQTRIIYFFVQRRNLWGRKKLQNVVNVLIIQCRYWNKTMSYKYCVTKRDFLSTCFFITILSVCLIYS